MERLKMKVTFTRRENNAYATVAVRDDNVIVSIPAHDRPKIIPHDLAHLIVERELGLSSGFWGKVANGAMFDGMKILRGRQKPDARKHSRVVIKDEGKQLATQAEVLVEAMVRIAFSNANPEAELSEMWVPPKGGIIKWTPDLLSKICADLQEASKQWLDLQLDDSFEYFWPVAKRG